MPGKEVSQGPHRERASQTRAGAPGPVSGVPGLRGCFWVWTVDLGGRDRGLHVDLICRLSTWTDPDTVSPGVQVWLPREGRQERPLLGMMPDAVTTATGDALRREGAGPGELSQRRGWRDAGGKLTFAPRVM